MTKKIIIIGAGGHAKSCLDVIKSNDKIYRIAGLVDSNKSIKKISNFKILGTEKDLRKIFKKYKYAIVGFGQIKSYKLRENSFKNLKRIGFKLPPIISNFSYFSKKSKIGEGSIVMHGVVVNAFSSVGTNCILNSNSTIEHDVKIGNNCHIAAGVVINGGVTVGNGTFIGSGSVIKEGTKIGKDCIISANIFIKKNVKDSEIILNTQKNN